LSGRALRLAPPVTVKGNRTRHLPARAIAKRTPGHRDDRWRARLNSGSMRNRRITSAIAERVPLRARRFFASGSSGKRLLTAAAVLHIVLAVGLFGAGRAQIAPGLIDRDGIMGSFAFDSYEYQREATRLVEILKHGGVSAWTAERAPPHVKLISIQFALLGPLFGYGTLSAEPFNLICYIAVLGLTLALGREVGGGRAGLFAAVVVALWPTYLLHTMQLLKDPLFIACGLALVLCVTTWLTRTFSLRGALATGALTAVAVLLLLLVRPQFAVVIFALVLIGFALLVVRQLREKRPLYWNMMCPLPILVVGVLLLSLSTTRVDRKLKHYPSDQGGQAKAVTGEGTHVPTIVSYLPRPRFESGPPTYAGRFQTSANRMALRFGSVRERFAAVYSQSGSNIDPGVRFIDLATLLLYLPRAFAIGCWAPFPNMWVAPGRQVGNAGKLLAGAETFIIYLFELLALVAFLRPPRRLAAWLLLSISAFAVTLLALVVPNVGALYRFRYMFWVLLIILGAKGFEAVRASLGKRRSGPGGVFALTGGGWIKWVTVVLVMVSLIAACSLSPLADRIVERVNRERYAQTTAPPGITNIPAADLTRGFDLNNITGSTIRGIYISPSDSREWEENVLGSSQLGDGETVNIGFNAQEKATLWDIRVESGGKYYAEWKGLDLRGVSSITLLLRLMVEPVAVAQVE
jgi:hypothetical protein